jgi:flagellar motor switch protein FliG
MTTAEVSPEVDELVAIAIPKELATLALFAANLFKKLPGIETMKLESMMNSDIREKPTAKTVAKICERIGFVFAMELDAAREKRLKEKANADSSSAVDP